MIEEKENIVIEDLIYEIKGKQVMLDSDLAKLYQVETKRINEAFKNNPEKFPERFSFRITEKEYRNLKSKFSTSSVNNYGGSRKGHTVFTEQGVAMLSTILKSKVATQVSIRIMDAFVAMKKYISSNLLEQKYINDLVLEDHTLIKENTQDIKLLQESFSKFEEKKKDTDIYFDGQIFDAYYKIYEIFKEAKKSLIIIDSYADITILDIIKRLNVKVTIITKDNSLLTQQDIGKYNKQYNNLKVIYDSTIHDRYFILDEERVYHCGTSVNRIGYKTFCINLFGDFEVSNAIIKKVNNLINKKMIKS